MFGLAIAAAACRKGSLMDDAGVVLTGSAGRLGSDGAAGGGGRQTGALKPGDPFVCANGSTTCVAGQSYCSYANKGGQSGETTSCQPLCSAGDCTCFCESPDGCDFVPADLDCQTDTCTCMTAVDGAGLLLPGGIAVVCRYTTPGACYPAIGADQACTGASYAAFCTGPNFNPRSGCTPMPDGVLAPACVMTEARYYCCSI